MINFHQAHEGVHSGNKVIDYKKLWGNGKFS